MVALEAELCECGRLLPVHLSSILMQHPTSNCSMFHLLVLTKCSVAFVFPKGVFLQNDPFAYLTQSVGSPARDMTCATDMMAAHQNCKT